MALAPARVLELIDLRFQSRDCEIAAYLVETTDGPALFDCGPATTIAALEAGLEAHGLALTDLRHLLLSHIHLDHAGAAGELVRRHPGLTVWVSEVGARHLADPSRLEASARQLFPDFDTLWGSLTPVPQDRIRAAAGEAVGWQVIPSPGHASHHVCYLRDGTLLAGDACGVRILPRHAIQPVSPPPDIDVEAWARTIDEIERWQPERLALIHFGIATDVAAHLAGLRAELATWSERVRSGMSEEEFVAAVSADVGPDAERYGAVFGFAMSWKGLRRYWDRRAATGG